MADAFAIVLDDVTAGIVVRQGQDRGYRFYAAERRFDALEGQVFRNPGAATRAAERLLREAAAPRLRRAA